MRRRSQFGWAVIALALGGCGTKYEGGCRLPDDTCLEWYSDGNGGDTASYAAECQRASGGAFSSASCPSSARVGTCLYDSLLNGRRKIYYSAGWTVEAARQDCDATRGSAGSFVAN